MPSGGSSSSTHADRSLTVVVLDVSPVAWGEREMKRSASDKARLKAGKRSLGPATLDELVSATQAFCSAFGSLEKEASLIIVGVAGSNQTAVLYPRKDALEAYFQTNHAETKLDTRSIPQDLAEGVAELVANATNDINKTSTPVDDTSATKQQINPSDVLGAMASAFSLSLCLINRFLVAASGGVSALQDDHSWKRGNADDEGVISAIGGSGGGKSKKTAKAKGWSPRVLLIQASDDRPADYNAFMNCAFASKKLQVVVDGCFIPSPGGSKSSPFLEQTCDLTGGLFLAPSGAAQANKALTEVLLSVFLPPRSCRHRLNLPAINKVDFRARSFDTGEIVDMAYVCEKCLSIFQIKPQHQCPTCGAEIRTRKQAKTMTSS